MPFKIIRADITQLDCDAIVNATDPSFSGSGGVDAAIHQAAGEALRRDCARLGTLSPGEAKLTRAYRLPCKLVIHTVGPVWHGGSSGEEAVLRSCYRNALTLAKKHRCRSVAIPPIASESLGYPKEAAMRIATDEIRRFLAENDMEVLLVVFGRESFQVGKALFPDIAEYIDQHYVDGHRLTRSRQWRPYDSAVFQDKGAASAAPAFQAPAAAPKPKARPAPVGALPFRNLSLANRLSQLDESFSQMLLRKIDERGITDAQCYKKANIDRKLFSKIRKDKLYKPSKPTAVAFAVALELSPEETRELLEKAGYALSHSSIFDVIIEYFIQKGNYNIFEINEALFYYDQSLLGG